MTQKRQRTRKMIVLISLLLFPITMFYQSPDLYVAGSLIFFALLFIASLFLGRAFCGYVCPVSGLDEICSLRQNKKVKGGDWIKFLLWPRLGLIAFLAVKARGYLHINPLYSNLYSFFIYYYIEVAVFVLLSLAVGRRSPCHHICWMAPFMIIGTRIRNLFKWPALHLTAEKEKCAYCGQCSRECPMSLDVREMVLQEKLNHSECILCGTCVDGCRKGVIKYTWKSGEISLEKIQNIGL